MFVERPTAEMLPSSTDHAVPTPWAEASRRLAEGEWYWLATVRPDGRPHVVPLLAVWLEGALYFVANRSTRKARNLAHDARCVLAVATADAHLVVEGAAARLSDAATLDRVADAYASRHGWRITVRDGAFWAEGAPASGGPPYDVYEVTPTTAFGFGTDEAFSPTRWRF
jgi:hypothetical protein